MTRAQLVAAGKLVVAVIIVAAVGRGFYADLRKLDFKDLPIRPGWLVLSGVLYLIGLGVWGGFWCRLLGIFGQHVPLLPAARAYYIGHLGKYLPGKAWTLLLRGALIRGPEARFGVAVITATYEVLTTMASGVVLAAVIFIWRPPPLPDLRWSPVFSALLLLGLLTLPLLPALLNRTVRMLAARSRRVKSLQLPPLRAGTLLGGLLVTGIGWLFLAAGLWAVLEGVLPGPPELSAALGLDLLSALTLAYVAGFLALVVPGGIGVREYILLQLLRTQADESHVAVAVLVLRVVWTAAEIIAAAVLWWFPAGRSAPLPNLVASAKKE